MSRLPFFRRPQQERNVYMWRVGLSSLRPWVLCGGVRKPLHRGQRSKPGIRSGLPLKVFNQAGNHMIVIQVSVVITLYDSSSSALNPGGT